MRILKMALLAVTLVCATGAGLMMAPVLDPSADLWGHEAALRWWPHGAAVIIMVVIFACQLLIALREIAWGQRTTVQVQRVLGFMNLIILVAATAIMIGLLGPQRGIKHAVVLAMFVIAHFASLVLTIDETLT